MLVSKHCFYIHTHIHIHIHTHTHTHTHRFGHMTEENATLMGAQNESTCLRKLDALQAEREEVEEAIRMKALEKLKASRVSHDTMANIMCHMIHVNLLQRHAKIIATSPSSSLGMSRNAHHTI